MPKNLKNILQEVEEYFKEDISTNQKAWGIISQFYHYVLSYMEKNKITKAELARRTGKSRAAISQMFNKNPNVSIKKIIEIADAIGINIKLQCDEFKELSEKVVIVYQPQAQSKYITEKIDISDQDLDSYIEIIPENRITLDTSMDGVELTIN